MNTNDPFLETLIHQQWAPIAFGWLLLFIIAFLPVGISHMEHPKILQGGASGALLCAYWPHATGRMQMRKFLLERVITCYNTQKNIEMKPIQSNWWYFLPTH